MGLQTTYSKPPDEYPILTNLLKEKRAFLNAIELKEKNRQFHMHPKGAYEIEVACPHTPKNRDTPGKGKMAVFCRFQGNMTPMMFCLTPVMAPS